MKVRNKHVSELHLTNGCSIALTSLQPDRGGSAPQSDIIAVPLRDCIARIQLIRRGPIYLSVEAIHDLRIALTTLRAIISFFRPRNKPTQWRALKRELIWLNSALGQVRNYDVALRQCAKKPYWDLASDAALALSSSRELALRTLVRRLRSSRLNRLVSQLTLWADGLAKPQRCPNQLDRTFCADRLRAWRAALIRRSHLDDHRKKTLHRLRIKCKRYYYAVKILQRGGMKVPDVDVKFAKTARKVQRLLGEQRDVDWLSNFMERKPPQYRKRSRALAKG